MTWIILVIFATVLDALRIFVDNYVSDVYFSHMISAIKSRDHYMIVM